MQKKINGKLRRNFALYEEIGVGSKFTLKVH